MIANLRLGFLQAARTPAALAAFGFSQLLLLLAWIAPLPVRDAEHYAPSILATGLHFSVITILCALGLAHGSPRIDASYPRHLSATLFARSAGEFGWITALLAIATTAHIVLLRTVFDDIGNHSLASLGTLLFGTILRALVLHAWLHLCLALLPRSLALIVWFTLTLAAPLITGLSGQAFALDLLLGFLPVEAAVIPPLRTNETLESGSIAYLFAHIAFVWTGIALTLRRRSVARPILDS